MGRAHGSPRTLSSGVKAATSSADPLHHTEATADSESIWNYSSVAELSQKVVEVLDGQSQRVQVLMLTEQAARATFPNLTVVSLGAIRKDKQKGFVTARVLFHGTIGIAANCRTRFRDQERAPMAADLKRSTKEEATCGVRAFGGRVRRSSTTSHR